MVKDFLWLAQSIACTAAELLRARLQGISGGAQKDQEKADHRSCPTCVLAAGRVRGVGGRASALSGEYRDDGLADRRLGGFLGSRTRGWGYWIGIWDGVQKQT